MKKEIEKLYLEKDFNCAETTLRLANKEFKLSIKDEELILAAGFGGGMGCGITCGLLSADIMVLSKIFVKERAHENPEFKVMCKQFVSLFRKKFGGTTCAYIKEKEVKPEVRCLSAVEANYSILLQFIKEKSQE